MYIRFVLDPFVPHGITKVIRRVVSDLKRIFKEVTYSIESDETLAPLLKRDPLPVSKVFQRKANMTCRGVVVYILSTNLIWQNRDIYGISLPSRCVIGLRDLPKIGYKMWSSRVWELILHELGHSFGLIKKYRTYSKVNNEGTRHCLNNCVMSEDSYDSVWGKRANMRFLSRKPYCNDCLKYLLLKDA